MSVYDLGDISRIVDRADASPAPTAGAGPWAPTVAFKACGCGVLTGEQCDCAEIAAQMEKQLDQPIWFGRRTGRAA